MSNEVFKNCLSTSGRTVSAIQRADRPADDHRPSSSADPIQQQQQHLQMVHAGEAASVCAEAVATAGAGGGDSRDSMIPGMVPQDQAQHAAAHETRWAAALSCCMLPTR